MRLSKLFGKTVYKTPADIVSDSYKLLYQAGYIRESVAGRYFFLPLGLRVQQKIMCIIKEEMDAAGAQEMLSPLLHPLELWKETNRTSSAGFELMQMKDRRGAEFALGGTAEEMFVDVVRKFQMSYKDLPINIYQFSTKFRDELRVRGGLLRAREFLMKDSYSFDINEEEFKKQYQNMWSTYLRIFKRLGLDTVVVESDGGYIGGDYCHEFQVICDTGEDILFHVKSKDVYFNKEIAPVQAPPVQFSDEQMAEMKDVLGKGIVGVRELAQFLNIPEEKTTKTILFIGDNNRYIAVAVRGGYDINETKVKRVAKTATLELANEKTIMHLTGAKVGFLGPLHLPKTVELYFDESTANRINFECGANKTDYHTINVNWERDIQKPEQFYDLKIAKDGDLYPKTGEPYEVLRGIEVGNIFQLGYHYTKLMKNAIFTDSDGTEKPYYMGCYGIGIGRTMATIVEMFHDKFGIMWPEQITPFKVHIVALGKEDIFYNKAQEYMKMLEEKNIEVLYDDRTDVSAGVKFATADLIGVPYRLVVSPKTGDKIELKKRTEKETKLVSFEELLKLI